MASQLGSLVEKLDDLAQKANCSRNDLINTLFEYAVDNCEVAEG